MVSLFCFGRLIVLAVLVCAVSSTGLPATAQTLVNTYDTQFPPPPAVPFMKQAVGDVAFVRDARLRTVFTSLSYPTDLGNSLYDPVDSLFVVCYGGGYVNSLVAASAARVSVTSYTIAASTAWYQLNRNRDNFPPGGAMSNLLNNFANHWREDLRLLPNGGMESHFDYAAMFAPFMPPVAAGMLPTVNYAIYASPDAPGGGGGNNSRTLGDVNLGMANQERQFVLLVQWDAANRARFAVNILRLYDAITRELGVPANRVAILYNNPAPAQIGPFGGPINGDPNGLLPPGHGRRRDSTGAG